VCSIPSLISLIYQRIVRGPSASVKKSYFRIGSGSHVSRFVLTASISLTRALWNCTSRYTFYQNYIYIYSSNTFMNFLAYLISLISVNIDTLFITAFQAVVIILITPSCVLYNTSAYLIRYYKSILLVTILNGSFLGIYINIFTSLRLRWLRLLILTSASSVHTLILFLALLSRIFLKT
jgi:hypothetical protein